jgi:hypothetical protein
MSLINSNVLETDIVTLVLTTGVQSTNIKVAKTP